MKILIAYGSTEGQTRKVARFAADRLVEAGHVVELMRAGDGEELDLDRFDAAILAGSVHVGRYQADLVDFAKGAAKALERMPTLFLSVSGAAAGSDPDDWKGLDDCVARFTAAIGWTPRRIEHVAGAFRFTEYDFFKSWAMRLIAAQHGQKVDPDKDTEFTDWKALGKVLDDWAGQAVSPEG
ncbi:flavodoxin domain-containing protein [Acidimangrovimonas pyrenivorans]|uniref:Flavodoxin domain-containing protein n=1 Tax=Acidimangrovimonas pyrenivorans TaxID=2030798 RepID=A0ABV7AGY2_9RHOB